MHNPIKKLMAGIRQKGFSHYLLFLGLNFVALFCSSMFLTSLPISAFKREMVLDNISSTQTTKHGLLIYRTNDHRRYLIDCSLMHGLCAKNGNGLLSVRGFFHETPWPPSEYLPSIFERRFFAEEIVLANPAGHGTQTLRNAPEEIRNLHRVYLFFALFLLLVYAVIFVELFRLRRS